MQKQHQHSAPSATAKGVVCALCALSFLSAAAPPRGGLRWKVATPGAGAIAWDWRSDAWKGSLLWWGVGAETPRNHRAGAGVWLPVGEQQEFGLAARAGTERMASFVLGWADRGWGGAEVEVPVIQPSARPLRTRWSVWHGLSFGRGAVGRAMAHWAPGSSPRVGLVVRAGVWRVRLGSDGLSVARQVRERPVWVRVGIHRGDVPWWGLSVGRPIPDGMGGFSASSRSSHHSAW